MKRAQGNPKVAVALVRVSTDRQELGPDAQRASIAKWAEREGVRVVAEFEEHITGSADIEDRGALLDALAALQPHGAGVFVVAKRDRLARSSMYSAIITHMVRERGAAVVSAAGEGDDATPEGRLMATIVDVFAEFERARIAVRTREGLAVKKARGERVGGVPVGKRADGKRLVDDHGELAALDIARQMRAQGASLRTIQAEMVELGVRGRRGEKLSLTTLSRVLGGR